MTLPANFATLEVNLSALTENYRLLASRHKGECGAVVKANAYGLGVEDVSKALAKAGCKTFFVATLAEAVELRAIMPQATIAVFNGLLPGEEKDYAAHRLTPVLNTLGQWKAFDRGLGAGDWGLGIIHIDTGMTRLGLNMSELKTLAQSPIPTPQSFMLMSHLACANDPAHSNNAAQLQRFKAALALFPGVRASLANSAGLFLSPDFHFDIARPGCALYGINPTDGKNPVRHVATLSAPLLQVRTLDRDETVGYGATYTAKQGSRIAIAGIGYSDGIFRSLGNSGVAFIGGRKVPFAGRVSMDMIALDVSDVPETLLTGRAEFINATHDVNDLADACDTIGYEIFTRIGRRVKRVYVS